MKKESVYWKLLFGVKGHIIVLGRITVIMLPLEWVLLVLVAEDFLDPV